MRLNDKHFIVLKLEYLKITNAKSYATLNGSKSCCKN